MKHQAATEGVSAADIERMLDRLAREIAAFGQRGRKLLPLYTRLETELATIRAEEDAMSRVLLRLTQLD